MSDIRELLDGIEKRAGRVQYLGYQYVVEAENAADAKAMLAALRAVLDEMKAAELRKPFAPEMAWCSVAVLREKITEALGSSS